MKKLESRLKHAGRAWGAWLWPRLTPLKLKAGKAPDAM